MLFLPQGDFPLSDKEADEAAEFITDIYVPIALEHDESTAEIIANEILDDYDSTEEVDTSY